MSRSASFARHAAMAGAALLLSFSTVHAAEILNYQGVWQASGSGDAYANVSTGLLGPGDYLVKWHSPQPFGKGSSWDDEFEVIQHAETYGGEVLFHQYFADCVCGLPLQATRSWTNQLHVEADRYLFFEDGFYYELRRGGNVIHARAGAEAVGKPFRFSVSTAPEPGAWVLMIGGFLIAGHVLRRRALMTSES